MAVGGSKYDVDDIGEIIYVVDGSGNLTAATQAMLGGGTEYVEDDAFTNMTLVAGDFNNTVKPIAVSTDGFVSVADGGSSLTVDDGGTSITVDGAVSVSAALPAGDNNIGNVDIVSTIATTPQIDYALVGGTAKTVVRAGFSLAADGDIVAAQGAGNIILVHAIFLQSTVAQTACEIKNGSGGSVLCYSFPGINGGFVLPQSDMGWFKTSANTALYLNSFGAAGSVGGCIVYTVVT